MIDDLWFANAIESDRQDGPVESGEGCRFGFKIINRKS
jgi:hypothetical protein